MSNVAKIGVAFIVALLAATLMVGAIGHAESLAMVASGDARLLTVLTAIALTAATGMFIIAPLIALIFVPLRWVAQRKLAYNLQNVLLCGVLMGGLIGTAVVAFFNGTFWDAGVLAAISIVASLIQFAVEQKLGVTV